MIPTHFATLVARFLVVAAVVAVAVVFLGAALVGGIWWLVV